MSTDGQRDAGVLRTFWVYTSVLGTVLIVLGLAAIALPVLATLAIEQLLGVILLISGIARTLHALLPRAVRGGVVRFVSGVLHIAIGVLLLAFPLQGAITVTLLLAILLVGEGLLRALWAVALRPFPRWVWVLLSGAAAIVLGVLILARWPSDAAWAIGFLVGIDLLLSGWSLLMLGFAVRFAPMET